MFSNSRPTSHRYPFNYYYTPALLYVNRQLYSESVGILYDNDFILHGPLSLNLFGDALWRGPDLAAGRFITQIQIAHLTAGWPARGLKKLASCSSLQSILLVIDDFGNIPPWSALSIQYAARRIYQTISSLLQPDDDSMRDKDDWQFQRLSFVQPYGVKLNFGGCEEFEGPYIAPLTSQTHPHLLEMIRKKHDEVCARSQSYRARVHSMAFLAK